VNIGVPRETIAGDLAQAFGAHIANLAPLRNSQLLVTGGTGFVGTWLAEAIAYLNDDHGFGTKIVLQSPRATQFATRLPRLGSRPDVKLQELDVRNLLELPEGVEWVIHAAASPDARQHASDPTRTIETIVSGTSALMKAAMRSSEIRRILNVSSGLVYGAQPFELERVPETYFGSLDPASFSSAYAEAKRLAETICSAYGSQYRLPITTARMFAFVGPYQLLDRPWAVNNFVRDAILGGNLRIHGSGLTVRSYMYPADMSVWLLEMLVRGQDGCAYNVGHPDGITLLALAERVVALARRPIRIETDVLKEKRLNNSRFVPDVAKAQQELDLNCTFDLEFALGRMMSWAASTSGGTS
jgi:nucleoside-diphosphate-sugar epimerase